MVSRTAVVSVTRVELARSPSRPSRYAARIVHADPDAIAGDARLRYLEDRAANLVAVANAHLVVGQSLHSEVLAERLSRDRTNAAGMPV